MKANEWYDNLHVVQTRYAVWIKPTSAMKFEAETSFDYLFVASGQRKWISLFCPYSVF